MNKWKCQLLCRLSPVNIFILTDLMLCYVIKFMHILLDEATFAGINVGLFDIFRLLQSCQVTQINA